MNKRTNKVKNGILAAVIIAALMTMIAGTYARFSNSGTTRSSAKVAKWNIVFGGTQDNSLETTTLTVPVQDGGASQNVVAGKIAPGKTVVATFNVDPTGSEVAVDYMIGVDLSNISGFSDSELELTNIKYILEGTNTEEDMPIDEATGNYLFEETLQDVLDGKEVTFKAYITWADSEDLERSLADTQKAATINNISIPINITARQHIGDRTTLCTVTFKDGETILSTETLTKRKTVTEPTAPTKNGYSFVNWYSDSELTTIYDFTSKVAGNTTIYAKWEPTLYTITYQLDDGTATNPTTYTIETDAFTLNNPSKNGYYFAGWTGSNGTTPQTEVIIPKGSTGNKTYTANYAQYTSASLRTFNQGDQNVSWSFDSSTGIYTITQKARSSGWGQGVVCDDSTTNINWGKSYMLEFEIYTPNTYTLKTDGNTMFASTGEGNDIYGTSWVILNGVRYEGELNSSHEGTLPKSHTITGGTWHTVQMYLMNDNTVQNPNHYAIRSFSGFALDLSSVTSNVTYQVRNLRSIVY